MMYLLLRILISALLLCTDASASSSGTDFTPIRSMKAPYVLEVYSTEQGSRSSRMTIVNFSVSDMETGKLLYACPDHWRVWDLSAIGWAKDGYSVIVDSSDVGTSSYSLLDDIWQRNAGENLYISESRDRYLLEVMKLDYLEEQDSVFFRVKKGGQVVYRSAHRVFVDDASQTSVSWAETGVDIVLIYQDGNKSVFRFSGGTWK